MKEHPEAKVLVFVRTKVRAERVMKAMGRVDIKAQTIHGDKDQSDRIDILNAFRSGATQLLIATDVTARGIDIQDVDIVVNYDLPDYTENYVHRVGRTGRGKKKGIAFSFCSPHEKELLDEIEGFLGKEITKLKIDKGLASDVKLLSAANELTMDGILDEIHRVEQIKKKKRKKR